MFEKAEGTIDNIAGRVQQAYGAVTGDHAAELEGGARRVTGASRSLYGDVLDEVRATTVANPLGTLAAVAGAAFVVGALWARR